MQCLQFRKHEANPKAKAKVQTKPIQNNNAAGKCFCDSWQLSGKYTQEGCTFAHQAVPNWASSPRNAMS